MLKSCPFCGDAEPLAVCGTDEVYCTTCSASSVNGNWNDRPAEDHSKELLKMALTYFKEIKRMRAVEQVFIEPFIDGFHSFVSKLGKEVSKLK